MQSVPRSSPTPLHAPVLSIVIPLFNEERNLPELERRLAALLESIGESWEVVFVDDGSRDGSLARLRELGARDPRYKIVALSRNFGHQIAITAGLDHASGEAVVLMDADLQDPPEVVRAMLERWREGFDVVYGRRTAREGETRFKRASAALFYRLVRAVAGIEIPADTGDFRLMSRRVVRELRDLREAHRFVRGMVAWLGFRQCAVDFVRLPRFAGETKYPLRKMARFAVDGITSFSIMPLRLATSLGALTGLVAFATGAWALYIKLFTKTAVPGWTTLMLLISLMASVQLLVLGILGEYVGRIYEEVKRRPLYVVAEGVNVDERPR